MSSDLRFLITLFMSGLLPFFRIMTFIHFCPVLDNSAFSKKIKIGLALILTIIITPLISDNVIPDSLLSMHILILIGEQILWGFIFGIIFQFIFTALQTAGHILSMNMGLSMAVMNDPVNGSSTTVISEIIYIFCGLLFFIMDGHLLVVSILYKSFTYWPVGQAINHPALLLVVQNLGWVISSATLIALPTTFIMLIVQGGFGLLNKVSPALNLFSLGFPISMLFGLLCLVMMFSHIPEHYLNLTNDILTKLDEIKVR